MIRFDDGRLRGDPEGDVGKCDRFWKFRRAIAFVWAEGRSHFGEFGRAIACLWEDGDRLFYGSAIAFYLQKCDRFLGM